MYRLTGTVTTKAIASAKARPHQNRKDAAVTTRALGIMNSIMLSINSIDVIDTVSVAKVIFIASLVVEHLYVHLGRSGYSQAEMPVL